MSFDVVFLGTAPFGFPVMRALDQDERVNVKGVFTQPDRERGRGREKQSPPVAEFARELNLPLFQPDNINEEGLGTLRELQPLDFGIVIAYGQILTAEVLDLSEEGFFNFHASLLPRWRGASPIRHALMHGDRKTGVTVFRVEEELDTGPLCVQLETPVREKENYGQLYERLSQINVGALKVLLSDVEAENLYFEPQEGEVTYAPQIDADAGRIDWTNGAESIGNTVRAFCPDPGAFCFYDEKRMKIYAVNVYPQRGSGDRPGTIRALETDEIIVEAASGCIGITELQPAGSRRMSVESFLAGQPGLSEGDQFDVDEPVKTD